MKIRFLAAIAVACAIALGGCITTERAAGFGQITQGVAIVMGETKLDPQIAKVSARLAERCGELQLAAVGVDLFAPETLRSAAKYGEAVVTVACANPPRTAGEVAIAIGKVVEAISRIEQAKRAV